MTAVGTTGQATQRSDWVSFADEPPLHSLLTKKDGDLGLHQRALDASFPSPVPGTVMPAPEPPTPQSTWVQFDDQPWTSALPVQPQVTGSSGGGVPRNRCSQASFWSHAPPSDGSWTSHSEDPSSLSVAASFPDLQSLHTEDQHSQEASRAHSPNSSVFQEDEDIDMDAGSWHSTTKQMNGQAEKSKSPRFASWVTFDDDEDSSLHFPGKPLPFSVPNPDPNRNFIMPEGQGQETEVTRNLLDLTPEKTNPAFTLDSPLLKSSTPSGKKNPFLDDELLDIQPSPINPFSAYFDKQDHQFDQTPQSNGSCSKSPHLFSFSSPFFNDSVDAKRDSILLFHPVFDTSSSEDKIQNAPQDETLGQFKQLHIADPDQLGSPTSPEDLVDHEELDDPPFHPSHMEAKDGWPLMLRIPEKKNIMSSRHWGPIFVKVTDTGCLQLFYEKGLEKPFKEFQLDGSHELSGPKLQNYDENGRVHTISIDHVTYKEKRKIQPKVAVVHTPVKEQLVKLGTTSYEDFLSFVWVVQDKLMHLPVESDTFSYTTAYAEEEILVEVRDEFHGVVSKGDNRIMQQLVVTHVNILGFVSSSPLCRIGFNDIQVKGNEIVSRHDIIPNSTTRWIKLRDCKFHKCVDETEFANSRVIAFTPPAGRKVELMHFRTAFAEKTLPFTLKTITTIKGAEVELQSWLVMSSGFSSNRDPLTLIPCENVMIRYPVPLTWVKNFRRDSVMGEKSLKARINKGASFGSTSVSGSEPVMRVTLGTAKYEHAFKAVVWRINRLPDKNSASGHPHTFFCHLELGSDREVPPTFSRHLDIEFDMPAASASKATVRSLSVEDKADIKKWVTYKSHYTYQVEMDQKQDPVQHTNGQQTEEPNECPQQ